MAGLVPAIYVLLSGTRAKTGVDARDKRGHDERDAFDPKRNVQERLPTGMNAGAAGGHRAELPYVFLDR
jgi:hypothetical protein